MMKAFRLVMVVAIGLFLGAAARPAAAQTSPSCGSYPLRECTAQANRTQVEAGGQVQVSGECPSAVASVSFRLEPGGAQLGSLQTTDGRYSTTLTIPSSTAPGQYQIVVTCASVQGSTFERTINITVVAPAATTATTTAAAQAATLPRTGGNVAPLAGTATGLLLVGGLAVVAARRRRAAG